MSLAYRYASQETFRKMIESHDLWFSDLRGMNDKDEYAAGFRIASEIVAREFPEHSDLLNEISPDRMGSAFTVLICCLSMDGDCLSMWRGYGDNGAGAAIGYDYEEIQRQHIYTRYLARGAPIQGRAHFHRVIYDEGHYRARVRADIRTALSSPSKDVQRGMMRVVLMRLCTLYKNDFFMDERELRGFIEVEDSADPYVL